MCINSGKPVLTLKQFLLRQQVKNLYKSIMKTIKEVPDQAHQNELKYWARDDFRKNANETDEMAIRMLIKYGERSLKELKTSLNLAK